MPLISFLSCNFEFNKAKYYGGAIATHIFNPYFDNFTYFNGNEAGIAGSDISSYPQKLGLSEDSVKPVNNTNIKLLNFDLTVPSPYYFVETAYGLYELHNYRSGEVL